MLKSVGPNARGLLTKVARHWDQGQHFLLSGPTGSGKTRFARELDQIRIDRGGHVVVFVMKPRTDPTILNDFTGFTRWKKWKRRPSRHDQKILLWPDVTKARGITSDILDIQKEVFSEGFAKVLDVGRWTVHVDEGLYCVHPQFLGMSAELAMGHAIGRSGDLTFLTCTQRPSHLPLILYGSASWALVGQTREQTDLKRLAELGSREGARLIGNRIAEQGRHDFQLIGVSEGWPAVNVNLAH